MSSTASPTSTKRILLVDDHPVTRAGLAVLITQDPRLVLCGEADSVSATLKSVEAWAPDVAIVDIVLKDGSGLDLTAELVRLRPGMPVIVLSMHEEQLYGQRALKAGARGYVMKDDASDHILTAIQTVLDGGVYLSSRLRTSLLPFLSGLKRGTGLRLPIDSLSDRELEVFTLIGRGFSTREIAAKLELSIKTIDSYREHIKVKMGHKSGAEMVRQAIQWANGIPLPPETPEAPPEA